ncbi:MAG: GxxExxY protein [Erythrobacter sp.]|nr:GxxExxY protein [Erythrobacter sp.]NCQ64881.1 GxxExxY protein [Alphaproteobacteria bacterium]
MSRDYELERLVGIVIDCGYHLHRDLGPGLLENAYERLMFEELRRAGIPLRRQVSMPLQHKGVVIDNAYIIDLLIADRLIVELKSVERLMPVHGKQVLTYLRLMNLPLGLLINFGQPMFKDGLKRIVNNYEDGRH